ncbi:MAG: aldo/keto reductase, partial [Planctomycetota bacterium]
WRRVPLTTPEPTFEPGAWIDIEHDAIQDISYDGILRCYEQGCEMLHPYKAQLVSVHDPDEYLAAASDGHDRQARMDDIMGAYQALRELRDAGHVTAIGVGSKDWRVSEEICKHCDLDWVMLATSLTIFTHDRDVLTFVQRCRDQSIRVINSAVFHSGFLTGGDFFDYKEIDPKHERDRQLMGWRDRFNAICESYGVSPAQACVSFGLSPPGVDSIALNSSQASRVQENVSLVSSHPPREFWQALKNAELIASEYPYLP